jgi:hypothetical protein
MSVADRVARHRAMRMAQAADACRTDSAAVSTSLVPADAPHLVRLRGVVSMLRSAIEQSGDDSPMARMAWIMTTFTDELSEEFRDLDPDMVRMNFAKMGQVLAWVGHGDNSLLPDDIRQLADLIQLPENASSHLAIDAPTR